MTRAHLDVTELIEAARGGQPRAIAKLISMAEQAHPRLPALAAALTPHAGGARIIGMTGPPGVGKSTVTSMLVTALRANGARVGVLAVDPTSPFTGGALLGDRIRMTEHATDPGVFIRSMATRGQLGGLALATPQAVRVLDAVGFDVVLIETAGVGQSEVDVAGLADTTVVLLAPGMGDGIQAVKAGVLEIADVFVVNKCDRDGADTVMRDLKHMISFVRRDKPGERWRPPVVRTVAARGEGVAELVRALDEHHDWLAAHGELGRRRAVRAASEIEAIALHHIRSGFADPRGVLPALADKVVDGTLDPYAAADALLRSFRESGPGRDVEEGVFATDDP